MPEKRVTATQARVHFGEVLRDAQEGPVIVERQGTALAVVVSKQLFDQLNATERVSWRELASTSRGLIDRERRGLPPLDPVEALRVSREEMDGRHDLR